MKRIVSDLAAAGAALVLFAVADIPAWAQTVGFTESFDDLTAPGWDLEPGWEVITQDGNGVLQGEGHVWASPNVAFDGDFRLTFRLRLLRGRIHLVYRLNDIGRYFIGFEQGRSDLSRQEWPDTFHENLASASFSHALNTWHQVEIDGEGGRLRFTVDGREEWEYTDPEPLLGGSFAFETLDDSFAQIDDIVVFAQPAPAASTSTGEAGNRVWVHTGGPLGGLGYDVRMRPDNPDRMYVTDAFAGVFLSEDGGQTWVASSEGITARTGESGDAIPVFCLTIDPNNPDTLWAGTQFQRGIFKSVDGGQTWTPMEEGVVERDGITFRGFSIEPQDSNVVYVAAEISSWAWAGQPRNGREFDLVQGVVYKTTDGGRQWTAIWRGDNLARYVWIDPRDPDVLYVSTGIFDREAANSDPGAGLPGGVGVLKSTDGGKTWREVNEGLGNLYVGSLFMHPANPDILLAGTGNNQYFVDAGVYLSGNAGASWQHVLSGDVITSVEFSASDPQIAYAGSEQAVYRSEDGGVTWRPVSAGSQNGWGPLGVRTGFPIDLQVDPRDPDRVFANNYGGGNFLSLDGGRTWAVASSGYTGAQVRDIVVDPVKAGRVIAASRSGLFASHDGGNLWEGLSFAPVASLNWAAVAVDPEDPDHMVAATNADGLLVESGDAGRTWRVTAQIPAGRMGWRALAFAPSDPDTVYAGTGGFYSAGAFDVQMPAAGTYVSHDGGTSWSPANDGPMQDAHVTGIAVDPGEANRVLVATANRGILRSMDGGSSWTQVNQGLRSTTALTVAIHPIDPTIVLTGLRSGGIYRSEDGGETWLRASSGLPPEASVSDVIFDPANADVLYASDLNSGVYRSEDGGHLWTASSAGLRTRAINALALSSDGLHLYAATEGGGVFRLDLDGQPPEAVPAVAPTYPVEPEEMSTPVSPPTVAPDFLPPRMQVGPALFGGALLLAAIILAACLVRKRKRDR